MENVEKLNYRPFTRFCMSIGAVPSSYLAGLSIEEQLLWLCSYLEKEVIPTVNGNAEAVEELQNLYIELKTYVDNYFENLDVQEEINNKLDEMAEDGQLADIISQYLNSTAIFGYDTVEDMKEAENLVNGSWAQTLGFYDKNDGGAALYSITNDPEVEADGASVILLDSGVKAQLILKDSVNIKQFGAKGDDTADDTLAIQKAIDYSYDNDIMEVFVPFGTYNITKPLFLYGRMKLFGDNCNSSIIHKSTSTKSDVTGYEVDALIIMTNRELDSTAQSQQQAIDCLQLVGNFPAYVADKSEKQYAIYSTVYSPKIKITNFLINHVDYGIYTPSMYTGLIQNCTYLEAHYGAIASYQESQGVNISNINTGNTHEFGIKLAGGSYSTLSNVLVEWNYADTCYDLSYWRGNLINCGAELGDPGFNIALKLTNAHVTLYGAYLNTNRDNSNLIMFKLDNSTLKIENSSFGYSANTTNYSGKFADVSNHSSLIIGEGCISPSTFVGGITRTGDNNTVTINDTKLNLTSTSEVSSIAGSSNRYEGEYIEKLNTKILNKSINSNSIYNGFVSTPTNNGGNIEYFPSFNKGDIGIFNNARVNGSGLWLCNKNNNSEEEPQTVGTISSISGSTITLTDCSIENYTTNGLRLFPYCTVKGAITGATKIVSWINFNTNTLNFANSTGLDSFQVGEKLKIASTAFARNGDYLYIPIINAGITSQRPSQNLIDGTMFFDKTLGKPVWYNNGHWYDGTGTQV